MPAFDLSIRFSLPQWVPAFCANYQPCAKMEDRMRFVIAAARRNVMEKTGGPFAAAVFESVSGNLVSLGVNLVMTEGLSILHAEIVALTVAQRSLGVYDLGAKGLPVHELVASAEPCAMCFGAIPWSGVGRVASAATDSDIRAIGFDEGPKVADWRKTLEDRGIEVISEILREEASDVLNEYSRRSGVIYNARKTSA